MTLRIVRTAFFSAGHAYSEKERYGHNFKVEAHFEHSNPSVATYSNTEQILKEAVNLIDHRYLNDAIPEFKGKPATPETIARFLLAEIQKRMNEPQLRIIKVRLFEGELTWADAFAPDVSESERDF